MEQGTHSRNEIQTTKYSTEIFPGINIPRCNDPQTIQRTGRDKIISRTEVRQQAGSITGGQSKKQGWRSGMELRWPYRGHERHGQRHRCTGSPARISEVIRRSIYGWDGLQQTQGWLKKMCNLCKSFLHMHVWYKHSCSDPGSPYLSAVLHPNSS